MNLKSSIKIPSDFWLYYPVSCPVVVQLKVTNEFRRTHNCTCPLYGYYQKNKITGQKQVRNVSYYRISLCWTMSCVWSAWKHLLQTIKIKYSILLLCNCKVHSQMAVACSCSSTQIIWYISRLVTSFS
jgi:hypothetical protein